MVGTRYALKHSDRKQFPARWVRIIKTNTRAARESWRHRTEKGCEALEGGLIRLETTSPFLLRWGTLQKGRAVFRREDR